VVIVASLAMCLNSLMIGYLSTCSRPPLRKRASDHGRACRWALPVDLEGRRQQSERARRGELDAQRRLAGGQAAGRNASGQERRILLVYLWGAKSAPHL
jgi:hypothetical protein